MDQQVVKDKLLAEIARELDKQHTPNQLLRLAEAYAWAVSPSQSHGGSNARTQ